MGQWYSRPVFFVESVERALEFYTERLGFSEDARHEDGGRILVANIERDDCAILLNCQQPDKNGRGRLFISLDLAPLQALRREFEGRGATVRDGWWGYDTMIVTDPDGNELYFPYPGSGDEGEHSQP